MISNLETAVGTVGTTSTSSVIQNQNGSASLAFVVSSDDQDQSDFNRLPKKVRDDLDSTLLALEEIASAKKIRPACQRLAPTLALHRPIGWHNLYKKYYAYIASGDWRCLVDWTRVKKVYRPGHGNGDADTVCLNPDFIKYLQGLMLSNQRKSEPAIRQLYRIWKQGHPVPGYGTWQEWFQSQFPHEPLPPLCPPDFPRGWSRSNLRTFIPESAELALARSGVAEARRHLPDILTTREGLRPLEFVMFDDVRTDFKILVPGFASPVELHLLVALDVATGVILRYGLRPAIPRADGMKDKLKLRDMKTLVAGVLFQYGVPRHYPMTLIVENATAAIRSDFEAALTELSRSLGSSREAHSPPRVAVHRTEMICGSAIWSGYKDRATGNPGGKAALESTFNLFHNELAVVPGQTGRRYDAGPAELHGRTSEAVSLNRTARHLSPHERAQLRMPFLNYSQARVVLTDIWNRICHRTDHRMEAFDVIGEWRPLSDPHGQWRPDSELGRDDFHVVRDQIEWRNPPRKESPFERWDRLVSDLVSLSSSVEERAGVRSRPAPFIKPHLGQITRLHEEHRQRPILNSEITFDFDKQTHCYRLANMVGGKVGTTSTSSLKNGTEVLCYFDPSDLSWIHLTDGSGSYLGSIPETRGIKRTDKAALQAAFKAKRDQLHQLQDRVADCLPEQHAAALEDVEHNVNVLADALGQTGSVAGQANIEDASEVGRGVPTAPSEPEPGPGRTYSEQIDRAKFAAAVAQRQSAARSLSPVPIPDCTDELLARAEQTEQDAAV